MMCHGINIKILRRIKKPVLLSFFIVFFFFEKNVSAQSYTYYTSGTWTCPVGVTKVTVECWGAGGAGGSANGTAPKAGAGGAGGGYTITNNYTVTPGNVYSVTVGKGGIGNAANTTTAP